MFCVITSTDTEVHKLLQYNTGIKHVLWRLLLLSAAAAVNLCNSGQKDGQRDVACKPPPLRVTNNDGWTVFVVVWSSLAWSGFKHVYAECSAALLDDRQPNPHTYQMRLLFNWCGSDTSTGFYVMVLLVMITLGRFILCWNQSLWSWSEIRCKYEWQKNWF